MNGHRNVAVWYWQCMSIDLRFVSSFQAASYTLDSSENRDCRISHMAEQLEMQNN